MFCFRKLLQEVRLRQLEAEKAQVEEEAKRAAKQAEAIGNNNSSLSSGGGRGLASLDWNAKREERRAKASTASSKDEFPALGASINATECVFNF